MMVPAETEVPSPQEMPEVKSPTGIEVGLAPMNGRFTVKSAMVELVKPVLTTVVGGWAEPGVMVMGRSVRLTVP